MLTEFEQLMLSRIKHLDEATAMLNKQIGWLKEWDVRMKERDKQTNELMKKIDALQEDEIHHRR